MKRQGWQIASTGCVLYAALAVCSPTALAGSPQIRRLPPVEQSASDIALMSFNQVEAVPLPLPERGAAQPPTPPEFIPSARPLAPLNPLALDDVIRSVQQTYPLYLAALLDRGIAEGQQVMAWGEFDTQLKAFGIAAPEGFYETYRNGVALNQPVFRGGYVYGGYKIGRGNFQPWFGERETNDAGELSAGFGVPLLKDRRIDKRRAGVFQADLSRQAVEPAIRSQLLEFVRVASRNYWVWVAAGRNLAAQRELLKNAEDRVRQIEEKVNAGDLPLITRLNNQQLIAARETKVILSDRKLQESAIKLSLFFRDDNRQPVIPEGERLPIDFPPAELPTSDRIEQDIALAIQSSPDLNELDLVVEQLRVELRNAQNMLLPKVDAALLASQDLGAASSSKRDKSPFELEAGLYGEVPLQRRQARGKIRATNAKLAQIAVKREFVVNKITTAVQDAVSALLAAKAQIERGETNLRLARETLELGRVQFAEGNIDLISLNIFEQEVTNAELLVISAKVNFFFALADYRAALALDPQVLTTPPSEERRE